MDSDCVGTIRDPMQWIEQLVPKLDGSPDWLGEARELLGELRESSREASRWELDDFAALLVRLLGLFEHWHEEAECPADDVKQLADLLAEGLSAIRAAVDEEPGTSERIEELSQQAADRWGECLGLLREHDLAAASDDRDAWGDCQPTFTAEEPEPADADILMPTAEEISAILSQVGNVTFPSSEVSEALEADQTGSPPREDPRATGHETEMSEGLREAFLDDAGRCVGSMEEALLEFEANPSNRQPLAQLCRELHTLKGASGSVGLSELAEYLHGVEDAIRNSDESEGPTPTVESLFEGLETIRQRVAEVSALNQSVAETPAPSEVFGGPATGASSSPFSLPDFADAPGDEESLRVKTSQLNRLMDMLAELVMLRNRRDCEMSELKGIHGDLIHSVSRLRVLSDGADGRGALHPSMHRQVSDNGQPRGRLTEVANDILDAAQRLRDSYQPVAEGNLAVSRFVRQFRQELVELRRMPVSGLFRRLRRVARDAARAEGKQVRLRLLGEDAGIERSLQERLYEPLLHIIRNAVSHGIEDKDERVRLGKDPVGNITLEARSGPDLLVIEVRDDGQGLDYDALRRRGLALGLLSPDKAASQEELAQLIFRPGFSTRQTASQVSGRGVGMDVVAETLGRMRGWVEVDSTAGEGAILRLMFPLPSVIQHTMVFRSGGQSFAVPMQFVQGAGDADDLLAVRFSELFASDAPGSDSQQLLGLACESTSADSSEDSVRRVAFLVDEIVGPEEVVVRPMPSLLKHHPLCSGATLSGTGVVLVLDARRLMELGLRHAPGGDSPALAVSSPAGPVADDARARVLVVDDSVSARKRLVRSLRRYDLEIVEAADGVEALEMLRAQSFAAVFSDLEMPRMSGLELLEEINRGGRGQSPPVVIVTSRTEDDFRSCADDLGASGYLAKPLANESLDWAIESIPALCTLAKKPSTTHQPSEIE